MKTKSIYCKCCLDNFLSQLFFPAIERRSDWMYCPDISQCNLVSSNSQYEIYYDPQVHAYFMVEKGDRDRIIWIEADERWG